MMIISIIMHKILIKRERERGGWRQRDYIKFWKSIFRVFIAVTIKKLEVASLTVGVI